MTNAGARWPRWAVRLAEGALIGLTLAALSAPWITSRALAPDGVELQEAERPPAWQRGGDARHWLGTDAQGRDVRALVLSGTRISVLVAALSVAITLGLGLPVGLISGYVGGRLDRFVMTTADAQLSVPPLLVALGLDGVATSLLSPAGRTAWMPVIVSVSIGLGQWALVARAVRSAALAEREKGHVLAAAALGANHLAILRRHLLPGVLPAVAVLASAQAAGAMLTEATLSFLGVGLPPTLPSLGTLVRNGTELLLSGAWWTFVFPAVALVTLATSLNVLADAADTLLSHRSGSASGPSGLLAQSDRA